MHDNNWYAMNFHYLLKSFLYFLRGSFKRIDVDVVFHYNNHLNRGRNGEPILFLPLINACKSNNNKYLIFEDTDLAGAFSGYPRYSEAIPFEFITLLQIVLRKCKRNVKNYNEYRNREIIISRILRHLFFRRFYARSFITIATHNVILFREVLPDGQIFDYQNGIIYDPKGNYGLKNHEKDSQNVITDNAVRAPILGMGRSDLINGKAPSNKQENDVKTLVYGDNFRELLISRDKDNYYNKSNVITIGHYFQKVRMNEDLNFRNNKCILFTLQVTPDMDLFPIKHYYRIIRCLLKPNITFLSKNKYTLLLKHHPRFNNVFEDKFLRNLPFSRFVNHKQTVDDTLENVSIHMTFMSTTSIEAAIQGIPTIFIDIDNVKSPKHIFFEQYKYPFSKLRVDSAERFIHTLKKFENKIFYQLVCERVREWSKSLYKEFNDKAFIETL